MTSKIDKSLPGQTNHASLAKAHAEKKLLRGDAADFDAATLKFVAAELKIGSGDGLNMAKNIAQDAFEKGKPGSKFIADFIKRYEATMTGPNPLEGISRGRSPNVFPNGEVRKEIVKEMESLLAELSDSP